MIRYALALLILLASSLPVAAQPFPGCPDGTVLSDPRAYVMALIRRAPGQDASDWEAVLSAAPLPATPSDPFASKQPANAPHYGITQWKGSSGNVRGRIALPTDSPDSNGYYTTSVDVLADKPGGGLQWAWRELHDGQAYAPRRCGTGPVVVPPPTPQSPSTNPDELLETVTALRKQLENLQTALEELKARPVPCFSGRIGGAVPVTLCPKQP